MRKPKIKWDHTGQNGITATQTMQQSCLSALQAFKYIFMLCIMNAFGQMGDIEGLQIYNLYYVVQQLHHFGLKSSNFKIHFKMNLTGFNCILQGCIINITKMNILTTLFNSCKIILIVFNNSKSYLYILGKSYVYILYFKSRLVKDRNNFLNKLG